MRYANRIVALVSGIMLSVACVYVSDKPWYNDFFGYGLSYAAAGFRLALPLFVLSLAWSWIAFRWLARPPRVAIWWCLAGVVAGWKFGSSVLSTVTIYHSCLDYALLFTRVHQECSVLRILHYSFVHEWRWTTPEFLAVVSGLAAAAWMVLRSERITPRASYA